MRCDKENAVSNAQHLMIRNGSRSTDLFGRHWPLRRLPQLLNRLWITSEVLLATDEKDGEALAEVRDL